MHTHTLTHTYIHTHNSAPATAGALSEEEKEEEEVVVEEEEMRRRQAWRAMLWLIHSLLRCLVV